MSLHRNRFYEDVVDEPPSNKLNARIAALEATVARLTAEPEDVEACAFETVMLNNPVFDGHADIKTALTAFLERRIKG